MLSRAGLTSFFRCAAFRIFLLPSALSIMTAFPSYRMTLYGYVSKAVESLFSRIYLRSTSSPSSTLLGPADLLASAYSFFLSLAMASLSLSSCCHSASVAPSLGTFSLGSSSWSFLSINSSAGDIPVVVLFVVRY